LPTSYCVLRTNVSTCLRVSLFPPLQRRPRHGAAVAGLAGEDFHFENRVGAGAEGGDFARAEIRLKVCEQAGGKREAGLQVIRNLLPSEIPQHGAEFVVFVKTDAMIDGKKFVRVVFKEDMTALAIGVVDEQVEERDGF